MRGIPTFFSFFSLLMILIFSSVISSYGQDAESLENIPDLRIAEFRVSDETVSVNGTIILSGYVENVGEYPAVNTLISVYSTCRPTMNITKCLNNQSRSSLTVKWNSYLLSLLTNKKTWK